MESLMQDLRYGARMLRNRPGFTLVAVLTLALGIGANTAMFSVIDGVLLRPLPFLDSESLVMLRDQQPPGIDTPLSYPEYLDWKGHTELFGDLGAYFQTGYVLTGGEPEMVQAMGVSANLLPMLGVVPAIGRGFKTEDDARNGDPVALIGDALWRRRFGADATVVGRPLTLDGVVFTIIGVLPQGFDTILPQDTRAGTRREIWVPLRLDPESSPRGTHFLSTIGRLRPGLTPASARAVTGTIAASLKQDGRTDHGGSVVPLKSFVVGNVRPALLILFGAVGLVLLIACANVANLLLARAVSRRREIAVRMALGAGRGRLVRQLLVESLLLAGLGGAAGLLIAGWGVDLLGAARADWLPRSGEIGLDPTVLIFTLGVSLATGLLFGLAPALRASRGALGSALKEGGGRSGMGLARDRLRGAMVVSQMALSLVLLAGAALLLHSFAAVLRTDPGFDPERLLTFRLSATDGAYPSPEQKAALFKGVLEAAASIPGVTGVAAVNQIPVGGGSVNGDFSIEGRSWPDGFVPNVEKQIVSDAYFKTMRTALLKGRLFDAQDDSHGRSVVIVNREFAGQYFPNEDPIGRRIAFSWETTGFQEIVGVVENTRHLGFDAPIPAAMFVPYRQRPIDTMTIALRSSVPPETLTRAARAAVQAIDKDMPLMRIQTMDEMIAQSLVPRRLPMLLLGGLALLALLLGAIGLFGVTSYAVAQRTSEIGVRMALGARPRDVLIMMLREGSRLVLAGTALGLLGALALTRLLSGLLYGVGAGDPLSFLAATVTLAAVSLLACYLPARRATRVDPMVALRSD